MNQENENTIPQSSFPETSGAHEHQGHVHGPNCSHSHSHQTHDPIVRGEAKVGRNDPCPCGSEQKFKKCHGK